MPSPSSVTIPATLTALRGFRWARGFRAAALCAGVLGSGPGSGAPAKSARLTDAQVARWVLSVNAGPNFVTFSEAGKVAQVTEAAKLPVGEFHVLSLAFTSLDQVTAENLGTIGRLGRLGHLEFKDGSGLTPAGVAALADSTALGTLIIHRSGLTDADLAPLSKIKSLKSLVIREASGLTGAVWQAWSGWGLTALTVGGWRVGRENLPRLAGLKSLQTLTFDGPNGLQAEDFSGWSHPSVWQLWLTNVPTFTGRLRPVLGAFPKASQVYIHGTPLDSQDCASLAQFRPAQYLQLSGTTVGDAGISALADSKSMTSIDCYGFAGAGTSLDQLARCRQLRSLGLIDGQLTDAGLARLPAVAQIDQLILTGNAALTDAGFASLAAMKQLRTLRLTRTGLTDTGLQKLAGLRKLEVLDVTGCPNITPEGVGLLLKVLPKCRISFQ